MILKGIPVSSGIIMGEVFFMDKGYYQISKRKISSNMVAKEIRRFKNAIQKTKLEIEKIKLQLSKEMGEKYNYIFDAHLLFLKDEMLIKRTISKIRTEKYNTEYILEEFLNKINKIFVTMEDEYIKERQTDIHDVVKRIIKNLLGVERETLSSLTKSVIIIATELSPSDTALMHKEKVIGFVTEMGGKTSHTAIMARSLEIPAVVGIKNITEKIKTGDKIIVNGVTGEVIIQPDKAQIANYYKEQQKLLQYFKSLEKLKNLRAETTDNYQVELAANIELPDEVDTVLEHGARGIGLFRTEFFYLNRETLPSEEEQFEIYKKIALKMKSLPVIIRTLDLGGDKFLSALDLPQEINPFLGWRAIRFCLERLDIFKVQLRAILRASVYGNLKIMFPLISGLVELRKANNVVKRVKYELDEENILYNKEIEVGIMIEVPSAVLIADILAKETDFFSIGTNDLIQYSLAVDRINEKTAHLYRPLHPAILRLLKNTIDVAHSSGIKVGLCGEMAASPIYSIILLGLGIDELSMAPVSLPYVKHFIRSISMQEAKEIVKDIFTLSTAGEIEHYLTLRLKKILPQAGLEFSSKSMIG